LARVRAGLSRQSARHTEAALLAQGEHVQQLIDKRALPAWRALPEVQSALAATWRQLEQLEKAREAFLTAIRAEGDMGRVPVKDIEQLANVEALLGERMAKADPSGKADAQALRTIDTAISRLRRLGEIVSGKVDGEAAETQAADTSTERNALLGSAWKRKAGLFARQLLRGDLNATNAGRVGKQFNDALVQSVAAYRSAEGSAAGGRLNPYNALNRLALDLLTPWESPELKEAAIAVAQLCRQAAAQNFASSSSIWDAAMQADGLLVERLLDGSFGAANAALGKAAFDEVVQGYVDALSNLTIKPSELESIVAQIELLARFFTAKDAAHHEAVLERTARQLRHLVSRLQPARTHDDKVQGQSASTGTGTGTGDAAAGDADGVAGEAAADRVKAKKSKKPTSPRPTARQRAVATARKPARAASKSRKSPK
jgi:hypothetical protein